LWWVLHPARSGVVWLTAQQGTESRAVLLTADLVGIDGHEVMIAPEGQPLAVPVKD
jgi:hypothetical protein